jgi:hypothetical protein
MMIATGAGLLTVCITEQPSESVIAQAANDYAVLRASKVNNVEALLDRCRSSRILIDGLLDALDNPYMPTRDAARTLGRLKVRLEALAESGVEVVVLCHVRRKDRGARSHFLNSLCASADQVVTELLAA